MFDTQDEAAELNSNCAFCNLEKFRIVEEQGRYNLERCADDNCAEHCKGGHDAIITQVYLNNEDAVAIASGW